METLLTKNSNEVSLDNSIFLTTWELRWVWETAFTSSENQQTRLLISAAGIKAQKKKKKRRKKTDVDVLVLFSSHY
jgi:hypothetical protein